MKTCMYLRKSREDIEKELAGIDTLQAHENILLDFAKKNDINIVSVKKEVVSGGSLYARPEMLTLLDEIEHNKYEAVLCIDIDRLGRAGMKEQGIILETFRDNNVLIITPNKTYNLNNESDMLHTDIKSFIARQELSLIKNRLKAGRIQSVKSGNYIHSIAPFGYKKIKVDKQPTLEIVESEANIIKLIFDMYVKQDKGAIVICKELKTLGLNNASNNTNWSVRTIKAIIHNPIYAGYVYYGKRIYKNIKNKKVSCVNNNYILVKGNHKAIISNDMYDKAQEVAKSRYNVPQRANTTLVNPLAGLIKCECGYAMYLKKDYKAMRLNCSQRCGVRGTNIIRVEKRIIEDLREYATKLRIDIDNNKINNNNNDDINNKIIILENNISKKKKQQNKLYDLLEQEIYSTEVFVQRNTILTNEINTLTNTLDKYIIEKQNEEETKKIKMLPILEKVIDLYDKLENSEEKNKLLKLVIAKIIYFKDKNAEPNDFKLTYKMKF